MCGVCSVGLGASLTTVNHAAVLYKGKGKPNIHPSVQHMKVSRLPGREWTRRVGRQGFLPLLEQLDSFSQPEEGQKNTQSRLLNLEGYTMKVVLFLKIGAKRSFSLNNLTDQICNLLRCDMGIAESPSGSHAQSFRNPLLKL